MTDRERARIHNRVMAEATASRDPSVIPAWYQQGAELDWLETLANDARKAHEKA